MTQAQIPVLDIFTNSHRIDFSEIQENDLIGVIDRIETGDILKINIASVKTNINFWFRKNSDNCLTSVASTNTKEIFLIHRPEGNEKEITPISQELFLKSFIENHEQSTSIDYKDISQGELVISVKKHGAISVGYADELDKFGWYTKQNMHLASVEAKNYLVNAK